MGYPFRIGSGRDRASREISEAPMIRGWDALVGAIPVGRIDEPEDWLARTLIVERRRSSDSHRGSGVVI